MLHAKRADSLRPCNVLERPSSGKWPIASNHRVSWAFHYEGKNGGLPNIDRIEEFQGSI